MEPHIVAASVSPNGNIEAYVEQDDRCAYLYLHELRDASFELGFGMKSCWVRNLKPAPVSFSAADMRQGLAPMLPNASCAHPMGGNPLSKDALRIVWFEEGDAAALLEEPRCSQSSHAGAGRRVSTGTRVTVPRKALSHGHSRRITS